MIKLSNGTLAVAAQYREQPILEYQNNPLIEALPPIYNKVEVAEKIGNYPYIGDEERNLDASYRMHLVQRIFQYFQALPIHLELEQRISRILRQSYVGRNPFSPEYAQSFQQGWRDIERGAFQNYVRNATAFGMSIVGLSGMGKTTTVNRIMRLIPQLIVHSSYQGKNLSMMQVPWIKLETPFDGSLKSLSLDFMAKVDQLIGSNYFEKYGKKSRLSTNVLLPLMGQIARSINLGVIIFDEVQHLTASRSGAEKVLNYFVTLVNEIGIPIIFISTPKGIGILQSEFRQARRSSAQGDLLMDRLQKDAVWDLFVQGLGRYQWTKYVIEMDEELNAALYETSMGIVDLACKIFAMAQLRSISTGKEKLTPSLIRKVAEEQFKLLKPMMEALKSGKLSKLAAYEDIVIPDISDFVAKEQIKVDIGILMKKETTSRIQQLLKMKEDAILRLKFLGVSEKNAGNMVEQVLSENPEQADISLIVQEAYKLHISEKSKCEKKQLVNRGNDLREIVKAGKEKGISAYDALRQAGYIKSDYGTDRGVAG
ncbi:ATP-binding protein [Paenibacillus chartarius]|uniref:ATP-binding protein n=1 Tax=Paenibacillus chartarius TaxID=747481 RepID=A0ABV6DHK4_9BACL